MYICLALYQGSTAVSSTAMTGMEGVFDDDDDMLIQASSKDMEDGDDVVNEDDDADSIDLGAIKKSMMPLIMGDEDSNAAGVCGSSFLCTVQTRDFSASRRILPT